VDQKTLNQNRLCAEALSAERSSRFRHAASLYRRAIGCDPSNPTPYLFFGYALKLLGDLEAATEVWSLGADMDPYFINAWRAKEVDEEIKIRSKCADESIRSHFSRLHRDCIAAHQKANPRANIDRIAAAIWCQTHDREFEYRHPRQRPHLFYVPDLPANPVYSRAEIEWSAEIERAWDSIKDEFIAAQVEAAEEQRPYLDASAATLGTDWEPLAASLEWGSFHLFKQGLPNNRLVKMFPKTLESLASVPLVRNANRHPTEILFSVLQGKRHIPPHFGVANTDIAVHLPIVVTPDSAIRVIDTDYEWQQGKVFAFDDSFEHESWNESPQTRVNLLFEVWHPDLCADERNAIIATIDARLQWTSKRSLDHLPI
jgi:tetratricopeptide (TPR) repeat protein